MSENQKGPGWAIVRGMCELSPEPVKRLRAKRRLTAAEVVARSAVYRSVSGAPRPGGVSPAGENAAARAQPQVLHSLERGLTS